MSIQTNNKKEQTITNGNGQPIRGTWGASILGPRNIAVERENPDLLASPETDAGTVPNLKFSYSAAGNRLASGGWAREVTVRELPVATKMAGVNMRRQPGGIREMHWHKEAEWGYMLAGRCRVTAVDGEGRNFIDDVNAGDIWNLLLKQKQKETKPMKFTFEFFGRTRRSISKEGASIPS
jgi:oxalate decarboxylase